MQLEQANALVPKFHDWLLGPHKKEVDIEEPKMDEDIRLNFFEYKAYE